VALRFTKDLSAPAGLSPFTLTSTRLDLQGPPLFHRMTVIVARNAATRTRQLSP